MATKKPKSQFKGKKGKKSRKSSGGNKSNAWRGYVGGGKRGGVSNEPIPW